MDRHLRVVSGPDQGRTFPIQESGTQGIGRSRQHSEICLHDLSLARVHCYLEMTDGQVVLVDSDGCGTLVNGAKVTRHRLHNADVIKLGGSELVFESDAPDDAAVPPSPAEVAFSTEGLAKLAGTVLGPYEIGPLIGKGHCGLVFQARHTKQERAVALKVLHPDFPKDDAEMQTFVHAVKAAVLLRHPNLVAVLGAGRTEAYCWIAMELVEGENVAAMLKRSAAEGLPDWRQSFRLAVHVGRALYQADQHGLVHGAITPRNVLFRSTDNLFKLGDLMQGRALAGSLLKQMTVREKVVRDLIFLSPEQTQPQVPIDVRSDIYNLGTVVYGLLTGQSPFAGESLAQSLALIRDADPMSPLEYQPEAPEGFAEIVLKMLAKRPEERHQSPGELLLDLMQISMDPVV
jgi:serine/threonine-protein kinase